MTLPATEPMIGPMMMSHHTHVALSHVREQELRQAVSHAHSVAARDRQVAEDASTVGRLRRRLAQMHFAPAGA
jgi:hypothetical protein